MKHRSALLLALLSLGLSLSGSGHAQHAGENFDPPKPNHPWKHEQTGLRLPQNLGGLECEERFEFEAKELGTMLRYLSEKQRIRADVFIYPCKKAAKSAQEIQEVAAEEAGNVLGEIMAAQKQGVYSGVDQGDATYQDIELFPEDAGNSCLLQVPLTLTIHEKDIKGDAQTRVKSLITLSLYHGCFIKARCTYPSEEDKKTATMVEDFVNQLRICLLEPGLRKAAVNQIAEYRADPLSAEARDAAGGVMVYAEKTPMFTFNVPGALATLAQPLKGDLAEPELDLFRAFLVGAVAAAIQEPLPVDVDLQQAGAEEVLKVHALMAKQKPGAKNPLMDDLRKAVDQGGAAAWFRAQDAKAQ